MAMNTCISSRRPLFLSPFIIGLAWLSSCSSADEIPGGGRVEHPIELRSAPAAPAPLPPSSASAIPIQESPRRQRTPSEVYEQNTGIKLSEEDKLIMDDCPSHALSKNVPKRVCAKDDQCGDGFCDRGRCAAIWTCTVEYGQRCPDEQVCGDHYLCIDGRCRSCIADSECKSTLNNGDPKCQPDPFYVPTSKQCRGWVPSLMGTTTPGPLPK